MCRPGTWPSRAVPRSPSGGPGSGFRCALRTRRSPKGLHRRSDRANQPGVPSIGTGYLYRVLVLSTCTLEPLANGSRAGTSGFVTVPGPMYSVLVPCTASRRDPSRRPEARGARRRRRTRYRYRVHRYRYGWKSSCTRATASMRRLGRTGTRYKYSVPTLGTEYSVRETPGAEPSTRCACSG